MAEFGYAGEILKVDLSNGNITRLPTADYADRFIGGRGIAAKLYWDMVPPQTRAFDPDNCLICVTGPAAGFTGLAGFRWQVCGKSPAGEPEAFSYGNLGGSWGGLLKYAGYDAMAVQGKSDKPAYIFIHDGAVEIRDASHLWGRSTFEVSDSLKAELGEGVSVMTIGPAAENLISFAPIIADEGASGSGGLGGVMGSKRLKAVVVAGDKKPKAAAPDRLQSIVDRMFQLTRPTGQPSPWAISSRSRAQVCYGCELGCNKQVYPDESGKLFKSFCQAAAFYRKRAADYSGDDGGEIQLLATRLCDGYGLDTVTMAAMIRWLSDCQKEGLLREQDTGLPLSKIGSAEFIETLTRKIALREGFGDVLAQGSMKAAESVGGRAVELLNNSNVTRASESLDYDPRLFMTTALFYATEPRRPIQHLHEVAFVSFRWLRKPAVKGEEVFSSEDFRRLAGRFWGSEIAADFSTYEGKALAAKKIQDRQYVKESMILCDYKFPMTVNMNSKDHVGDPTLESQVFSAITGKEMDEAGLYRTGERIWNLQRAVRVRQGWGGREGDRLPDFLHTVPLKLGDGTFNPELLLPGKDGKTVSRLGAVVERAEFEKMKSEYYTLRGWDVESGLQTKTKLKELELNDVASDLEKRGLVK